LEVINSLPSKLLNPNNEFPVDPWWQVKLSNGIWNTTQERQDSSGRPAKPIDKAAQLNHFKNIMGLESFIVGQLSEEQIVNPLAIAHCNDTQSTD
jgi:hypothetical protein